MKPLKRKRVVLGIDDRTPSQIAASLLRNQGYEVFPLHLTIDLASMGEDPDDFPSAFSPSNLATIEKFCESLGVSLSVKDVTKEVLAQVYDPLWMAVLSALPDSPQIRWVSQILLPKLWEFAREVGADSVATGHFAQIREGIYRFPDFSFDQSAAFARALPAHLNGLVLPLGEVSPVMIVRLGREIGVLQKPEEEETPNAGELALLHAQKIRPRFTFTPEILQRPSVQNRAPGYFSPGVIRDRDGATYGEHAGLPFFPVGTRVANPPNFVVTSFIPETRAALIQPAAEFKVARAFLHHFALLEKTSEGGAAPYRGRTLEFEAIPSLARTPTIGQTKLLAYPGKLAEIQLEPGRVSLTRGQEVVFYEGSRLVGAGRVAETRLTP